MATPAPDAVLRLVDRFDQDRKVFLSGDYKEGPTPIRCHRGSFVGPTYMTVLCTLRT
ncbi:MAG: hypothetical protein NTX53_12195 [candidate division WOR-3 bacterium]|nr:hypothetical protein [candidate division WOR-3 bacterium]